MRETQLTALVRAELRAAGWLVWPLVGGEAQPAGLPDFFCARPGTPGAFVEAKRGDRKLAPVQRHWARELRRCGVPLVVLRYLGPPGAEWRRVEAGSAFDEQCVSFADGCTSGKDMARRATLVLGEEIGAQYRALS